METAQTCYIALKGCTFSWQEIITLYIVRTCKCWQDSNRATRIATFWLLPRPIYVAIVECHPMMTGDIASCWYKERSLKLFHFISILGIEGSARNPRTSFLSS